MFNFHFLFTDGITYDVGNVNEIEIKCHEAYRKISGDDILSTRLPLDDMFLYTPGGCIAIAGKNLLVIDALKQGQET